MVCGGARSGGEGNCYGSSVPVLWLCCGCAVAVLVLPYVVMVLWQSCGCAVVLWQPCGPVVVAEVVLSYAVVVVSRAI